MAKVYYRVNGQKITKFLAVNEGVQAELEARQFEIAVRAEELLLEHRLEGHAQIDMADGAVDKYVILSDDFGDKAALSIEFGRQARVDPKTGEAFGEMEGLFILTRAANLPIKKRKKVKI